MVNQKNIKVLLKYILVGVVCLLSVFPVLWIFLISIKPVGESMTGLEAIFPHSITLENYANVIKLVPYLFQNLWNSIFVSVIGTITTLFFCSLAGYAFAKYYFPGRKVLYIFILATMMVPQEVGVIPLFIIFRNLGLVNNHWGLIIPRLATAVGIFYMTEYIRDIPDELVEAAKIDGCSDFMVYLRIIMPVIKPALSSWAVLTMIARWNDFFWPLILLRNTRSYTLMVAISNLPVSDGMSTPWQTVMAGVSIAVLPLLICYIFLQSFQVVNVTMGAVKG